MYPRHPTDGVVISGSIEITPPLSADDAALLESLAMASFRAAVAQERSALVDKLAPGHPEGPSGWVTCEDGCCLEIDQSGYVRVDAIEPWLGYIVGTMHVDRTFAGSLMLWDCAARTFTALTVEGTKVRRRAVLEAGPARSRPRGGRSTAGPRRMRSV